MVLRLQLTLPGIFTAPPITTTSFTRRKVSGSSADAKAKLVSGPTATSVTVSGSFSRNARKISLWAGSLEGMKEWSSGSAPVLTVSIPWGSTAGSKRCSQVWPGVRCGCYIHQLDNLIMSKNATVRCWEIEICHTLAWMPPSPSVPSAG